MESHILIERYRGSMFLRVKKLVNFAMPAVIFALFVVSRFEPRSEDSQPYGLIGLAALIIVLMIISGVIYIASRNEYIELGPDYILYHDGRQQARFFLREVTRLMRVSIPLTNRKTVSCFRIESGPDHFLFGKTGGLYEEAFPLELRSRGGKNRIVIDVQETDDLVGRIISRAGLVEKGGGVWEPSGAVRYATSSTAEFMPKEISMISGRDLAASVILCLLLYVVIQVIVSAAYPGALPDEDTYGYTSGSILDSAEVIAVLSFAIAFPVVSMLLFAGVQRWLVRESWIRATAWATFGAFFVVTASVAAVTVFGYDQDLEIVMTEKEIVMKNLPGMDRGAVERREYKDLTGLFERLLTGSACWTRAGAECVRPAKGKQGLRPGMYLAWVEGGFWIPSAVDGFDRLKGRIIDRAGLKKAGAGPEKEV